LSERPSGGERVVLVHVNFPAGKMKEDLDEFQELVISAGANIIDVVTCNRRSPESRYFVGSGKAEEIRDLVTVSKATLVIFNHNLSPAQQRNLERLLQCRVVDRTGLILDIFAQRARSFEGKLQVELALLSHQATRLVRGWTHLERQRGGIGVRGGPGETQLETDRRLIRGKIKLIEEQLTKIRKQRDQGRRARRKADIPTIALVGYTNAGKSTLFNSLTGADVYVADQLFATLDPTLRRVDIPELGPVILADTVGFIRHLPHDLVEAFHATLEEVIEADLLLHVIDMNDDDKELHIDQVNQVLEQIKADKVPRILVYNKIDLNVHIQPKIDRDELGQIKRVYISAAKSLGLSDLAKAMQELVGKEMLHQEVVLAARDAKLRAELYECGAVLSEAISAEGDYQLEIRMPRVEFEKLFRSS
jgi:GTP-binding protein HflX